MKLIATFLLLFTSIFNSYKLCGQTGNRIIVLGTAQDGGYPQAGCSKSCCIRAWKNHELQSFVTCLALVNQKENKAWLIDITPDFREQWQLLKHKTNDSIRLAGIFITHAHIGHYAGLVNLGREVMGANEIPVYVMPRMKAFLESNGPWSLLVKLDNIRLVEMHDSESVQIGNISITPITVPHRDEYSETVGFRICGNHITTLFIPDIDKWNKWNRDIVQEVEAATFAFLDASFMNDQELGIRGMKDIPHPFVTETVSLFAHSSMLTKAKIHFIHINHTNPILYDLSSEAESVKSYGFHISKQGEIIELE